MKDKSKAMLDTRKNWQHTKSNDIANSTYYIKCEEILKNLGSQYIDSQMTIIDLGCADGRFTELLSRYSKNAIGYELSQSMLDRALKLRSSDKLKFFSIDLQSTGWTLPPSQLSLCMGVFTYIYEDSQMKYDLRQIYNSLKEGNGEIFITRESLSKTQTFCWMTQDKYYSIYRSYNDYYKNFINSGFAFINEIKLFEDEYVINSFRIWRCVNL